MFLPCKSINIKMHSLTWRQHQEKTKILYPGGVYILMSDNRNKTAMSNK